MAIASSVFLCLFFALAYLHAQLAGGCYTSIFSFGDSLADTGNLLLVTGSDGTSVGRLPYGETFFHRPTGRFSDGRLMIDFIAQAMGLPFVRPYLAGGVGGGGFRHGVNFAVGGATALDAHYFESMGMEIKGANYSLSVQLEWFRRLLPSLCSSASGCAALMSDALFLVGEIGGNDYNGPFFAGRSLSEITAMVPDVVRAITSAVDELIGMGARTMVVPGNFPIGCSAAYLSLFQNEKRERTGCIKWLNDFAEYHNRLLEEELRQRRRRHPGLTISYADYYQAAMEIYAAPQDHGFGESPLAACCGSGGGDYNLNSTAQCGEEGSNVCSDPSRQISWDGLHLTEAAYRVTAGGLLGRHITPSIARDCPELNWTVPGDGYVSSS
ncbi:GDSL esterase/lipase At1g28650-like [Curcuma longa]|uniref:GDSL esterase/lipase At1g28650-like n=1 Tax=Curcuma longa TaxID=136217 RepID=UPI003D9EF57B